MTSPSQKSRNFLLAVVVGWAIVLSAGPTLVVLLEALVPLVIVVGIVAAVLLLVAGHSRKW